MADQQDLELEALRAIYGEDFIDCPPPKVWKVGLLYYLVRILVKQGVHSLRIAKFIADFNMVDA